MSNTLDNENNIVEDRSDSIEVVKSFNVIKQLIWNCTHQLDSDGEALDRDD